MQRTSVKIVTALTVAKLTVATLTVAKANHIPADDYLRATVSRRGISFIYTQKFPTVQRIAQYESYN